MSFQIYLQNNLSDERHLDKELVDVAVKLGTLRDGCDVRDPVILIECQDITIFNTINYFTIPALNRSYFLRTAPVIVRTGLVEIGGHCDVLSTFKTGIRAQSAIIKRAESSDAYNLYLNDGSLHCYQDPYILTEPFPGGFTGASFILAVAGGAE